LRASQRRQAAWRIVGQQVMFSRLSMPGRPVPMPDAWDGYQASRDRVLEFLAADKVRDLAILTGDIHSSWACDVPASGSSAYTPATGAGSLAVEFVTPAISSPTLFSDRNIREAAPMLPLLFPHVKYLEGNSNGYLVLDITPARLQAEWYHVPDVWKHTTAEARGATFVCERGSGRVARG
jgi:alkaline phosphatase D